MVFFEWNSHIQATDQNNRPKKFKNVLLNLKSFTILAMLRRINKPVLN